jgi:hypothetical protein
MDVWISSPVRSRKPGVDEEQAMPCRADAFFQVDGGAALLVHYADFQSIAREPQRIFGAVEQLAGEGDLTSPVHLRFDDID